MLLNGVVNKRVVVAQLLLGGGLAGIRKLIQAWHRWRKGGHGLVRIRSLMLLNGVVNERVVAQLLLGGGSARIRKLIQAWHRWRKGGMDSSVSGRSCS